MKSTVSADDILETAKSKPRPIQVPSIVAGYMADLIIHMAQYKKHKVSNPSGFSSPSDKKDVD